MLFDFVSPLSGVPLAGGWYTTITLISDSRSILWNVVWSVRPSVEPSTLSIAAAHWGDISIATPAVFLPAGMWAGMSRTPFFWSNLLSSSRRQQLIWCQLLHVFRMLQRLH